MAMVSRCCLKHRLERGDGELGKNWEESIIIHRSILIQLSRLCKTASFSRRKRDSFTRSNFFFFFKMEPN